jgi:site-specific recombinase XerD
MSGTEEMADRYIAYKQALGFDFAGEARRLRASAAFLGIDDATEEAAIAWACSELTIRERSRHRRYETVRRFSRFAHALDPAFPAMRPGLLGRTSERAVPHFYSEEDTCLLMCATLSEGSSDSLKGEGLSFLIGLMGSCGLRVSGRSALRMPTSMRMLRPLATRDSKFDAPRTIPVSPITAEHIAGRSRKKGGRAADSMIVSGGEAPQQGLCGRHVLKETLDASGQR